MLGKEILELFKTVVELQEQKYRLVGIHKEFTKKISNKYWQVLKTGIIYRRLAIKLKEC